MKEVRFTMNKSPNRSNIGLFENSNDNFLNGHLAKSQTYLSPIKKSAIGRESNPILIVDESQFIEGKHIEEQNTAVGLLEQFNSISKDILAIDFDHLKIPISDDQGKKMPNISL